MKEGQPKNSSTCGRISYRGKRTSKKGKMTKKNIAANLDLESISLSGNGSRIVLTPPASMQKFTPLASRNLKSTELFNQNGSKNSEVQIASDFMNCELSSTALKLDSGNREDIVPGVRSIVMRNPTESSVLNDCQKFTTATMDVIEANSEEAAESAKLIDGNEMTSRPKSDTGASTNDCHKKIMQFRSITDTEIDFCSNVFDGHLSALEQGIDKEMGVVIVEQMEISDGSFVLDTQTLKMISDVGRKVESTGQPRPQVTSMPEPDEIGYSLQKNCYILNGKEDLGCRETDAEAKAVYCNKELDTSLLFSGSTCQFDSSFLTQRLPGRSPAIVSNERNWVQRDAEAQVVFDARTRAVPNGDLVSCKSVNTGQASLTDLVPLSIYERERCTQMNRYSDTLFDEEVNDAMEHPSDLSASNKENGARVKINASQHEREVTALSNQSLFLSSDFSNMADNSIVNEELNLAVVERDKDSRFMIRDDRVTENDANSESLTASMIAKVLADNELTIPGQSNCAVDSNRRASTVCAPVNGVSSELMESCRLEINAAESVTDLNARPGVTREGQHSSAQKEVQKLSPTVEALMDMFCGNETRMFGRTSKRTKSYAKMTGDKPMNCSFENEPKRLRKNCLIRKDDGCRNENTKTDVSNINACHLGSFSSGSDSSVCIPPTPPSPAANASKMSTPKRLLGGVTGTPKRPEPPVPRTAARHNLDATGQMRSDKVSSETGNHVSKLVSDATNRQQFDDSEGDNSMLASTQSLTIIDVAASRLLFENFVKEWQQKERFSLSVACERITAPQPQVSKTIGGRFAAGAH